MLRLNNISRVFNGKTVFENLSATFEGGNFTALMGPSGSGKTTLLNIIAGLDKPTDGTVVNDFKSVSYAFQDANLPDWLTAAENVNLVLGDGKRTMPCAEQLLSSLGFTPDDMKKYPRQLSGGMKRRVSLARAFAFGGELLLLDEPFKELDGERIKSVADYIKTNYTGKTVIITTHNTHEAELLGAVTMDIRRLCE